MKSAIISLALLALLAGCTTPISERAIKLTQPDVVEYDKESQAAAAEEMKNFCTKVPTLCAYIIDYGVMRDQARAGKGETVNIKR